MSPFSFQFDVLPPLFRGYPWWSDLLNSQDALIALTIMAFMLGVVGILTPYAGFVRRGRLRCPFA